MPVRPDMCRFTPMISGTSAGAVDLPQILGRRHSTYVPSIAVVAFCLVGTGGLFTPEVLHARDAKGYRFPDVRFVEVRSSRSSDRRLGAAECLSRIKTVFRSSMTDLASMFGVSRQAIYNWQSGQSVSDENLSKLVSLAETAELIMNFGLESDVRRVLPGGKSVAEEVISGAAPPVAVATLGALVKHDQRERDSLSAAGLSQLGGGRVDMSGAGLPKLNELG